MIRTIVACAMVGGAVTPALAVSLEDMKTGAEIMVGTAAICSDYLKRPDVLEDARRAALTNLTGAGLSESEANELMENAIGEARADLSSETQMQMACEFAGIKALPTGEQ